MQNNANARNEPKSILVGIFNKEKTISSQLPIVFKSGYKFHEGDFESKCDCCSADLKGNLLKGSIFSIEDNDRFDFWAASPISEATKELNDGYEKVLIDAVGFCPQCAVYSPYQLQVFDKGLSESEALARQKVLDEQKKNKNKLFNGINILSINKNKSMREKNEKEKDEIKRKTQEMRKKMSTKESSVVSVSSNPTKKQTSVISEILQEKSHSSSNNSNTVDMNLVSKAKTKELVDGGRNIQDILTSNETVLGTLRTSDIGKDFNKSLPPLGTERRGEIKSINDLCKIPASVPTSSMSAASQKLKEVVTTDDKMYEAEDKSTKGFLSRRAQKQAELMKRRPSTVSTEVEKESFTIKSVDANLLNHTNQVNKIEALDQPELLTTHNSKTYVEEENSYVNKELNFSVDKDSIKNNQKGKSYVQSNGGVLENVSSFFARCLNACTKAVENFKIKRNLKKDDILKGYKYTKPTVKGGSSARDRLVLLRENNNEFVRPSTKVKARKHNHDSFK